MLSGRGLCDELITRTEESYRLWCVVVCDLETSRMRRLWPTGVCCAKKNSYKHFLEALDTVNDEGGLIFMDPCIVDASLEIPTRCSFVIEFIISKFIEGSTCFERHTAHHQEL